MVEQDVYCTQFVNLQIFTFVQVETKLPIYFPLFPSMTKSSIFTNSLTSLWRLVSEERIEFHFVNTLKTLRILVSYSNLRVLGFLDHSRSTGLPGMKQMTKPNNSTCIIRSLSSYNYTFPSGK